MLSFGQMATKSKFLSMNIKKMVDLVVNYAAMHSINEDVIQSPIILEFTNGYKLHTKLGLYEFKLNVNQFDADM